MPTRERHLRTSAIAALVILVTGTFVYIIGNVDGVLYMQAQTLRSAEVFDYVPSVLAVTTPLALWRMIPLTLGAFLSFWVVMPIRPSRRLSGAIGSSVVAVLISTALSVIVFAVRIVTENQSSLDSLSRDPQYALLLLGTVLNETWSILSSTYALVIAVGLGAWGGLMRSAQLTKVTDEETAVIAPQ